MVRRSQDFTAQEIISSRLISRARRPLFIVGFPQVFVCFLNKYIIIFWYHDVPIFNFCFISHIWFKIKLEAWCWFSGDPCNFSQSYGIKYPIGWTLRSHTHGKDKWKFHYKFDHRRGNLPAHFHYYLHSFLVFISHSSWFHISAAMLKWYQFVICLYTGKNRHDR